MTNDRHKTPEGGTDDERRQHADRDGIVKNPWSPAYDPIRTALLQIGVDIYSPDSVEEFCRSMEWSAQGARRQKWWREMRSKVVGGCAVAAACGAGGAAFQWLSSHTFGIGH